MKNETTRKMLSRMNTTAQYLDLGDIFPIVVTKKLAAGDITSGKCTIDAEFDVTQVAGAMCTSSDGTLRSVTAVKIGADKTKIEITATGISANDTVIVIVI